MFWRRSTRINGKYSDLNEVIKKIILKEKFKQALISTAKVISDDYKIDK